MTVAEAIEKIQAAGELRLQPDGKIRYRVPRPHQAGLAPAVELLRAHRREALTILQAAAEPLEAVLKGLAVELWCCSSGERFWLVADEEDAKRLREPRGSCYTAAEARRVVQIPDPEVVREIHEWKRRFNATLCDIGFGSGGCG